MRTAKPQPAGKEMPMQARRLGQVQDALLFHRREGRPKRNQAIAAAFEETEVQGKGAVPRLVRVA